MKIRTFKTLIALCLVLLTACSTAPSRKTANIRKPAATEPAADVDGALNSLGLRVYFANLHSHHFMKSESRKGKQGAANEGEPDSSSDATFPYDDGRPQRNNADGVRSFIPALTPGQTLDYFSMACAYGKSDGALDILYVTPHTKNGEQAGEADTGRDALLERHRLLDPIGKSLGDGYLCGLGQEASSISSGNHITILGHFPRGAESVEPFFFPAGSFDVFYPQVKRRSQAGEKIVLQLNHPNVRQDLWWKDVFRSEKKQLKGVLSDYGLDDFAPVGCAIKKKLGKSQPAGCTGEEPGALSWESLRQTFAAIREASGDRFRLIEIVSPGGATSNSGIEFRPVHRRLNQEGIDPVEAEKVPQGLSDYLFYLNMGFHLGPTANQDNHFMNWGSAAASRTGVLASSLSEADVLTALENRRVFASEDRNARLVFSAGGSPMGSVVSTTEAEITLELGYTDPDTQDSAALARVFYYKEGEPLNFTHQAGPLEPLRWLDLSGGKVSLPTQAPASYFAKPDDPTVLPLKSGEVRRLQLPLQPGGQYVFVEITQQADQDKLWSAPVWIDRKAAEALR